MHSTVGRVLASVCAERLGSETCNAYDHHLCIVSFLPLTLLAEEDSLDWTSLVATVASLEWGVAASYTSDTCHSLHTASLTR